MNPPKAERAKPSLSSDYNLLFKNKIGESSLDIHRNGVYRLFGQDHDFFGTLDYSKEESDSHWKRSPFGSEVNAHDFSGSSLIEPDWNDYDQLNVDYIYRTTYRDMGIRLGTRYKLRTTGT